jgi:hypothetical protein
MLGRDHRGEREIRTCEHRSQRIGDNRGQSDLLEPVTYDLQPTIAEHHRSPDIKCGLTSLCRVSGKAQK